MLTDAAVTANIPAADLDRARAFYSDVLGLEPTTELHGEMLLYSTAAGTTFQLYRTDFAGQAGHTIAQCTWPTSRPRCVPCRRRA